MTGQATGGAARCRRTHNEMITINLQHGPDGWIETFSASGHAGYAADGPDIICAAISVLAQTAIGSLQ